MNNRPMYYRAALLPALLLLGAFVIGGLWLRAAQRQHTLNRRLIAALVKGDTGEALRLVNAGADPNTRYKPTPIPSLKDLLNQFISRPAQTAQGGPTALIMACGGAWESHDSVFTAINSRNAVPLVASMIAHNANVNAHDDHGFTALSSAAMNSPRPEMLRLLLGHGANVNAPLKNHWTVLMAALFTGAAPDTVSLLLSSGANVKTKDVFGLTALSYAVRANAGIGTIKQLLALGADTNVVGNNGKTPLMFAQQLNRPDLVALLRHAGEHQ